MLTTASWSVDNFNFSGVEQTLQLRTDAQGIAKQDLKLGAGYHELTLKAKDAQGHETEVRQWVYVFRSKDDWFQRNQGQIKPAPGGTPNDTGGNGYNPDTYNPDAYDGRPQTRPGNNGNGANNGNGPNSEPSATPP